VAARAQLHVAGGATVLTGCAPRRTDLRFLISDAAVDEQIEGRVDGPLGWTSVQMDQYDPAYLGFV
jgi:hypothetical protein